MLQRAVTISPHVVGMIVQVQSVVSVMVVVCILAMHHQVLQLASLLGDCHRGEHAQRLPQQDSQKEESARTANHMTRF